MSLFDDDLLSYDYSGDNWSDWSVADNSSSGVDWSVYDTSSEPYDWTDSYAYDGGQIDLSNSEFMMDGSENPSYLGDQESSGGVGGAVSSALKWLGGDGGANLGSALLGGYELYDKYDTNKDVKELLAQQLYNSENDQYRAFTGQAGEHTRDAYTASANQQKMDLMMSLMANDKHLPEADRTRLMSGMAGVTDRYAPAFEGYANDNIGRRNAKYSADYNSEMPFPTAQQVAQQGPLAQTQYIDYMKGIPEGTDPTLISAYQKYLGL